MLSAMLDKSYLSQFWWWNMFLPEGITNRQRMVKENDKLINWREKKNNNLRQKQDHLFNYVKRYIQNQECQRRFPENFAELSKNEQLIVTPKSTKKLAFILWTWWDTVAALSC